MANPNTLESPRFGHDSGIDPDHLSLQIDQRFTAVSRVDRRIGLQKVFVAGRVSNTHAMLCADNPLSYALEQTPGLANGHHPLAYFNLVGIPEYDVRKRPLQ